MTTANDFHNKSGMLDFLRVIALQTFIDPNFHVRTAAAADADTARRGVYLSVAAWIVFDILQLVVGLYALAALGSSHGAQSAIHVALQVLPDIWRGIYVAGIVAAVMGVVHTMGSIGLPPAELGKLIGAALVGTFLGILLAYAFVSPVAKVLEQQAEAESRFYMAIKAILIASLNNFPPAAAVDLVFWWSRIKSNLHCAHSPHQPHNSEGLLLLINQSLPVGPNILFRSHVLHTRLVSLVYSKGKCF
jgi:hypothetical protein